MSNFELQEMHAWNVLGRNIEAATKAMLKALSQLETPEEKIAALCSRYADLLTEHKKLQNHLKDNSKSQQQVSGNNVESRQRRV